MCDGSLMDTRKMLSKLSGRALCYALGHRSTTLTSGNGQGVNAVAER